MSDLRDNIVRLLPRNRGTGRLSSAKSRGAIPAGMGTAVRSAIETGDVGAGLVPPFTFISRGTRTATISGATCEIQVEIVTAVVLKDGAGSQFTIPLE